MVVRGWGGSIATAVGVAAAVGAAQLGLGYGMEIISWRPGEAGLTSEAWLASLAWATWIAATSTIAGAIVAHRLATTPATGPRHLYGRTADPDGERTPTAGSDPVSPAQSAPGYPDEPAGADRISRGLWRMVLAAAAALGATVTVALTAVPARLAEPAETTSPQTVAAGYAVLGVVVGLIVAVAALTSRAVAANLIATSAWLWLLAVVTVVDGVLAGRDWDRVPLAFWVFTEADPGQRWGITAGGDHWFGNIFLPDAGLAAAAALVIGALAALPAARRGDGPVGVAVSGAVGPLVVAAGYLLAQPDLVGAEVVDISRHLVVPYLIVTGLVGSLLVSLVRPRSPRSAPPDPAADPAPDPDPEPEPEDSTGTTTIPKPRTGTEDDPAPKPTRSGKPSKAAKTPKPTSD